MEAYTKGLGSCDEWRGLVGGKFGYHSGGKKGQLRWSGSMGLELCQERMEAIEARRGWRKNCHYWNKGFWVGKCVGSCEFLGKVVRFGFHSERRGMW